MENKKMDRLLLWGIILNALRLALENFTNISDFLSGLLLGMSIVMMLVGIYRMSKELGRDSDKEEDSEEE